MTRIYLAGPMTGIPSFNFPAFMAAAEVLRGLGYDVVSPAEMDDEETAAAAMASPDGAVGSGSVDGETWGDFLARDIKLIADGAERQWIDSADEAFSKSRLPIDGLVMLPGWENSRGARLEAFVGLLCGKVFAVYDPDANTTTWVPDSFIKHQLALQWAEDLKIYAPINR